MKPILTYSRCSTQMQANFGVSLESQSERLQQWASSNGYEIVESFVDSGVSGTKLSHRPHLTRCLDRACKEKLPVLTYSISRISRSVKDMAMINERLSKAKVQLISITEAINTDTAAGRLTYQLFVSLAEHESSLLRERTCQGMKTLRASGKQVSRFTPYGYKQVDGYLKPLPKELEVIGLMKELREQGLSYRDVAAELTKRGHKPHHAAKWGAGTIIRILARETEQVAA